MKILFVEDELSKHVDTMLDIFNQFIGTKLIKEVKNLTDDQSGYGASPDEIVALKKTKKPD